MTTPVRVLGDMGPLRVTVEGESSHWTPAEEGEYAYSSGDEIRCHSLDESRSGLRRTNCIRADEEEEEEDRLDAAGQLHYPRGAILQGPRSLAFRRVASPSRLHHLGSADAAARLRPRSSSGGRRSSDTTAPPAKENPLPDGLAAHGHGHAQIRVLRLSRDATQPNSGSLSDLRGSQDLDGDEESDVLPALGGVAGIRPRAYTCPDMKAMQRRTKVRLMNRPPTPTPGDDLVIDPGLVVPEKTEKVRSRTNSGEVFTHNGEDDTLPVISET